MHYFSRSSTPKSPSPPLPRHCVSSSFVDTRLFPPKLPTAAPAADIAHTSSPDLNAGISTNFWSSRHRAPSSLSSVASSQLSAASLTTTPQSTVSSETSSIARPTNTYRHSLEMKSMEQKFEGGSDAPTPANNASVLATPPKLQPSFSANDVPTLKTVSGSAVGNTPNQAAQQHLHNHNASMGRIPAGALPNRHSRELSADGRDNVAAATYQSLGSTLHANATPFGPALNQNSGILQGPALPLTPQAPAATTMASHQGLTPYSNGYYAPNAYGNGGPVGPAGPMNGGSAAGPMNGGGAFPGVPMLSMQMHGMSLNGANGYSPANYAGYGAVYAPPQPRDSQARVIQTRRQQDNEGKQYRDPSDDDTLLTPHSHESLQRPVSRGVRWQHLRAVQGPARLPLSPEAAGEP